MAGVTWPALIAGQKAKSSEVEAKFDWLEEDLVPMTGGTRTDDTYDLGEPYARWRDVRISRQILLPQGTAVLPPLAQQGATTGVFFPTTTAVGFTVNGTELQRITLGGVRKYANPGFRATSSTPQTITAAGVVTFTTKVFDVGDDFTLTGQFTAPIDGVYLFAAGIPVYSAVIVSRHNLYFRVDDTVTTTNPRIFYGRPSVNSDHFSAFAVMELSAGSHVDCWLTGTIGADTSISNSPFSPNSNRYFCGYFIG